MSYATPRQSQATPRSGSRGTTARSTSATRGMQPTRRSASAGSATRPTRSQSPSVTSGDVNGAVRRQYVSVAELNAIDVVQLGSCGSIRLHSCTSTPGRSFVAPFSLQDPVIVRLETGSRAGGSAIHVMTQTSLQPVCAAIPLDSVVKIYSMSTNSAAGQHDSVRIICKSGGPEVTLSIQDPAKRTVLCKLVTARTKGVLPAIPIEETERSTPRLSSLHDNSVRRLHDDSGMAPVETISSTTNAMVYQTPGAGVQDASPGSSHGVINVKVNPKVTPLTADGKYGRTSANGAPSQASTGAPESRESRRKQLAAQLQAMKK